MYLIRNMYTKISKYEEKSIKKFITNKDFKRVYRICVQKYFASEVKEINHRLNRIVFDIAKFWCYYLIYIIYN